MATECGCAPLVNPCFPQGTTVPTLSVLSGTPAAIGPGTVTAPSNNNAAAITDMILPLCVSDSGGRALSFALNFTVTGGTNNYIAPTTAAGADTYPSLSINHDVYANRYSANWLPNGSTSSVLVGNAHLPDVPSFVCEMTWNRLTSTATVTVAGVTETRTAAYPPGCRHWRFGVGYGAVISDISLTIQEPWCSLAGTIRNLNIEVCGEGPCPPFLVEEQSPADITLATARGTGWNDA